MKKIFGKILALSMSVMLVLSLTACSSSDSGSGDKKEGGKIGVAMPTKDLQRWNQDGENMKKELEEAGYEVDLQYANNDIATQVSQIENMITGGCKLLVIASIDGGSLSTVLQEAKNEEIPVIAYDRLIMDTDAVSYYATFDNHKVGQIQGQYIVDTLKLDKEKGPFNLELFTGSSDDNNCRFFFGGAMEVLQKYIDEGKLVVQSKQTKLEEVATPNWSTEEAQKRMDNILTANYTGDKKVDVVLSSNDSVANGVTNALKAAGYTKDNFPVLTGQDCDITSVKNILKGTQSMSVFKDTRKLATQVVKMVGQIMSGEKVDVNDEKSYDNGKGVVPTYLCEPVFADKENYKELLIDSGYYTEDKLK
ncbi:MAG: multiple monosaccharide ABC transporter substrate-binding protein [Terrisporobacter othiniensis]|uniref:multiple monosaccharide ABC transporter substrate-binding protein n=1 Tax=Terrisporobacter petrolearius TaxID=1460447 RepID=UPI0022E689DA|nr:multiple monosaccharide ABC transporter substrate-binding protein [Terrisporobacter petrolearius]MDU4860133.1 multiple monosaccharide ABC transporter substrate-binding protein [Terrisporobacter othiniensis]MDU6994277.1 multiple monosaccharide ABC transporter substrate-binding protein [Terrisporobacter othiniensis]